MVSEDKAHGNIFVIDDEAVCAVALTRPQLKCEVCFMVNQPYVCITEGEGEVY